MRRKIIAFGLILVCALFLFYDSTILSPKTMSLSRFYIENAYLETGAENAVTSIYLFYRYYDTLFETLMLLFSIIGVIYMSIHEGEEHDE